MPPTPTFRPPRATPRLALPDLASRKNPVFWAFPTVLMGPVNRVNTFRSAYLVPQVRLRHHPLVNGASQRAPIVSGGRFHLSGAAKAPPPLDVLLSDGALRPI